MPVTRPSREAVHRIGELCVDGDWARANGDLSALHDITLQLAEYLPEPLHCQLTELADSCHADPGRTGELWSRLKAYVYQSAEAPIGEVQTKHCETSGSTRRRIDMKVQDLMSHPAITCNVNDDLNIPAKLMWDRDCGIILVLREDGKLAGVITDRDICMAAYTQGRSLDQILVNAVMATNIVTARPDQGLADLERMMVASQVRRIPVIDGDNRPIGVVSLNDLAIESVEPDTRMEDGRSRVARTLAAVCRPRTAHNAAA